MASDHFKRVIIAGSRNFCTEEHYKRLEAQMDSLILTFGLPDEIVSGTARGADQLGERYARENQIPIKSMPADWDTYGKSAGYLRNKDMAEYGTCLVVFWDGESKGTQHMIRLAGENGLDIVLTTFTP
jgi:hypothetical protein